MATANLSATPRTETGKGVARKLRAQHNIPGVLYGHHRDPQPLVIDARELDRLVDRYATETTVVELSLEGQSVRTLIREIQRHPFKRQVLHVDFQALVAGEKVTVDVPIILLGTPEGVRIGGVLDQILRELTVEVDPSNIPNHIDVDVSALGLAQSLHVSDLTLPDGITVLDDAEATVCVVAPPRVAEEEAAPAEEEEAGAEPELIRKTKEEEGEEGE
ncbi:MAG TPA: 50S ribosomal protein L25 [Gemmatimonadaceae bacterium]|nr:50S ribosomal protein L25 [Gemmatimonadaceae bacterium]